MQIPPYPFSDTTHANLTSLSDDLTDDFLPTALTDNLINADIAPQESKSLQAYFKPEFAAEDVESIFKFKRAQPILQSFSGLFQGNPDAVMMRLLVLQELASDLQTATFSRADINVKLSYLQPDGLDSVVARLRSTQLLIWDATNSLYRVSPIARNVLSAINSLINDSNQDDVAEMGFLFTQVAGAQAFGGVPIEQLQHLLGRLYDLTNEFKDAIASGSEYRLRTAQAKWNNACDWVEKGTKVIYAITKDGNIDAETQNIAQKIGRAQSILLNMQGMFSRALNQVERQRINLGQSGLSTTDIKNWLMNHADLASLAIDAVHIPVKPCFATPAEMIDVAEAELFVDRISLSNQLPLGQDTQMQQQEQGVLTTQLDTWITELTSINEQLSAQVVDNDALPQGENAPHIAIEEVILPSSFAIASYRASLLPLIGDPTQTVAHGVTAKLAQLGMVFDLVDSLKKIEGEEVAAMSDARLSLSVPNTQNNAIKTM